MNSYVPRVPDGIVSASDFRLNVALLIVDRGLVVDGVAAAARRHRMMRRFRMADEERAKAIEELNELRLDLHGRARDPLEEVGPVDGRDRRGKADQEGEKDRRRATSTRHD